MIEPAARTHADRMALAERIRQRAMDMRDDILAVAIYGSTARGDDGPYSDLEIMCVVDAKNERSTYSWTTGPWKADVNFRGRDVVQARASEFPVDWALTKGQYAYALPIYDPQDLFSVLRTLVFAHNSDDANARIHELIVGEIYELIGKYRNMHVARDYSYLPACAIKLVEYGAWALGLAHLKLYTTNARMFHESLQLPNRPSGYDTLCQCVMRGVLHEPLVLMDICEKFWWGLVAWTEGRGIGLVADPMELGNNG